MKLLVFCLQLVLPICLLAQQYKPVDEGSKIHFTIKNSGINTGGDMADMKGNIKFNPAQLYTSSFDITVAVNTLDTDNRKRDEHLQKADYFDAEKYPVIRLVSTSISAGADENHFIFKGNLTIKGTTKPVQFVFTASPKNKDMLFTGNFEINRLDFGVGSSSMVLSNIVKVSLAAVGKGAF